MRARAKKLEKENASYEGAYIIIVRGSIMRGRHGRNPSVLIQS